MRRNDAEAIGDMIRKFFRVNGLESPLNEYRLVQALEGRGRSCHYPLHQ